MYLAELQDALRDAVVLAEPPREVGNLLAHELTGGTAPLSRLDVHRRHYRASLVGAIAGRFPGTGWLLGEHVLTAEAERFVRAHPPSVPCIAEYGGAFPDWLSASLGNRVPYVHDFAALEWLVGAASVAVTAPSVSATVLAHVGADDAADVGLVLQPGLRYLQTGWAVDRLLSHFLAGDAPATLILEEGSLFLEVEGSRGNFSVHRLPEGRWHLRRSLAAGWSLERAAEAVEDQCTDHFDLATEITALFAQELVVGLQPPASPVPVAKTHTGSSDDRAIE